MTTLRGLRDRNGFRLRIEPAGSAPSVPIVTGITLSPSIGTANSAAGTVIGTLSATVTGPALVNPQWSLVTTAGGDFQLVNSNQVAVLPSNVPAAGYSVQVQVAASNLPQPFVQAVPITMAAQAGPMSQSFALTNFGSATSLGVHKRGVWFKKGDVAAGSIPALSSGTAQLYGVSKWSDGSLRTARLLLRDASVAAGATVNYTMTAATGSLPAGSTAAVGNAGLVSALAGHSFAMTFANVKTWDCSSTNGNYAPLGSGAFTASLAAHAAVSTRWTLLTTGPVADVWQGWGMATDNASGTADAHLKVNWYVTRWKNADGSTLAFQVGAVVALDWWSVANKYFLQYDAALVDGSSTIASYPGVKHQYQSQWIACTNDGSLNAGTVPWVGATQPTLHCTFDRAYAVAAGVVPPLDIAKRPTPAPQYAYVPCGVVADPDQIDWPNCHRPAIDAAGGYQGRGILPRFDADDFMTQTPASRAVVRLNALSGLGVPFHYRSNRTRTRPGDGAADTANTIIPLLMAPQPASYSDFTAQGLPIAVDAYTGGGTPGANCDGFRWQVGIQSAAVTGQPYQGSWPAGSMGPWGTGLDASHAVSYCYYMALISGDEWLVEAQLDLAMNLAHQTIYGFHQNCQLFPAQAGWNSSAPTTQWSGLLGQFQPDNQRSLGWSQNIQGHAFGLLPVDHVAYGYTRAALAHNGDYIQGNLDNMPADFATSGFYAPESQLGLNSLFSPWMCGFVACGAYAHFALNEDARWQRLGDFTSVWAIQQGTLGRWYAFDIYRTAHRRQRAAWNAGTNPELAVADQVVLQMSPDLNASTGVFTLNNGAFWSELAFNGPPLANGDKVLFTTETDGGSSGVLPPGAAEGQVAYIVNLVPGSQISYPPPSTPPTFQLAATPGGTPLTWSTSTSGVQLGYFPQAASTYAVAQSVSGKPQSFPYIPTWDNYVPVNVSVVMMARLHGSSGRVSPTLRDAATAFTQPMDQETGYYSAFDMATTA